MQMPQAGKFPPLWVYILVGSLASISPPGIKILKFFWSKYLGLSMFLNFNVHLNLLRSRYNKMQILIQLVYLAPEVPHF